MGKINHHGIYTPFQGVTVIASLVEHNLEFCSVIYQRLACHPIIRQYFSLLPQESYHMTMINLYTDLDVSDWSRFISKNTNTFQKIKTLLTTQHFDLNASVLGIHTEGVIQLVVELSKEQNQLIQHAAHVLDIKKKVPAPFHITLAYQYKALPAEMSQQLKNEISHIIQEVVGVNRRMALTPPKLCYFKDMTAFIEWDATSNPFKSHPAEDQPPKRPFCLATLFDFFFQPCSKPSTTSHQVGYQKK